MKSNMGLWFVLVQKYAAEEKKFPMYFHVA